MAAAACDAVTQRIPTALVRQAGLCTGGLLIVGLTVHYDWRGLILSGAAVAASGLTMLLCWRFAGAGFGDVRLATLGGLGLGHTTYCGALVGLVFFCGITLIQAGTALARGGNRDTPIPFGPALATAALIAAAF
jgi:leader peptidase (prepilin peptidase)/N-methyltransferase